MLDTDVELCARGSSCIFIRVIRSLCCRCFLRVVYTHSVKIGFLMGKSKIAPLTNALTIPKLELIAAYLSVRLVKKIVDELGINLDRFYYWVDAMSVLHLINNMDKRFKVFVANRLSLIHAYSKATD